MPFDRSFMIPLPTMGQTGLSLPYTSAQLNDPRISQSILDQRQAAQNAMAAATSTAPHSSGLVTGLQAAAGLMGGQLQSQANAAAPTSATQGQSQSGQPESSVFASLLRNMAGSPSATGADDGSDASTPPASGWAGVGQGLGQAAQQVGRKSDRRLKSDVARVGVLPNGLAVYRFRLQGGPPEIGLMADEVIILHPSAVWEATDGFLRVDYSKAVL